MRTLGALDRSEQASDHHAQAPGRLVLRRGLFDLLEQGRRVTLVSAPAGSGKTSLMQSWIAARGLNDRVAWVSVSREERDPQAFWLSLLDALRKTRAGTGLVRELTAAPGLEGATVVARICEDLQSVDEPVWIVIDDLHELEGEDAVGPLEVLLRTAPAGLRFVLLTRRDQRLGLHRLRLDGQLAEIRGEDILFTVEEARELFEAAGIRISERALTSLVETTEGWVAGLRLAALSLTRHPDPEGFAEGFSGRQYAVAEYLLAEVLERQPKDVSRMLLRTSVLDRVSGPLADRLSGGTGSELILAELANANAFVVPLNPQGSWFRYHHLFADLLALELRRTAPQEIPSLHLAAAEWFAEHDDPVDAIRHAQAAGNWGLAGRLLADNWRRMYLDGRVATGRELLSAFPSEVISANAELAVLTAFGRRAKGSLTEAERYLRLAERNAETVPQERRGRFQVALTLSRLAVGRARNDLEAVAEEATRLLALTEQSASADVWSGEDLRATALTDLGVAEIWAGRFDDAERHLDSGLAEARRIDRPSLELQALSHQALLNLFRGRAQGEEPARQAVELARAHGWEDTAPAVATACIVLASAAQWRGALEPAEAWLQRAERVLRDFAQPTTALMLHAAQGLLEFARGRYAEAMSSYREVERMESLMVSPHVLANRARAMRLQLLVASGEMQQVRNALADMDPEAQAALEMRVVRARLSIAEDKPETAAAVLASILDGSDPISDPRWGIQALLLGAIASDLLRDAGGAALALERALDLAEPDGLLLPFLLLPAPSLIEQHRRLGTSHAAISQEILNLLAGRIPSSSAQTEASLTEPLSDTELRVLRYLPTNLQAGEIGAELFVSVNTIRTHVRHLYSKLGVHTRADAVKRARELGLLAPSTRER